MNFAKRGRPSQSLHGDMTDEDAFDFLSSHCVTDNGPAALWPYTKGKVGDWKKSIILMEVKKIVEG